MAAGGRVRSAVLFGALALTLASTAWMAGREEPADEFAPVSRAAAARSEAQPEEPVAAPGALPPQAAEQPAEQAAGSGTDIDLARLHRETRPATEPATDAFSRHSWYVPPPPPKTAPPPRPTAPPLPFKYMGRLVESGREIVFLTGSQDRNFAVSAGDTITGTWRVESISGNQMTLTYLPLGQQQTLQLAGGD